MCSGSSIRSSVRRGIREASPIVLGYVPIGMAYGLLARQAGFPLLTPLCLSFFVFAGSSQFIAVSMLSQGAPALAVTGTAFVVNFRHFLMSAALAPRMSSWKMPQRLITGCLLTDESFALNSARFARGDTDPAAAIALSLTAYAAWVLSGAAGHRLGALIARPEVLGLDFALPAMFIGLLLPFCSRRPAIVAAVCGGASSLLLHRLGMPAWATFAGALVGATAGLFFFSGEVKNNE